MSVAILLWAVLVIAWILYEALVATPRRRALVLRLLSIKGITATGLELVHMSNGKLKRGTVYVTLNDLEREGLIVSEPLVGCEFGRRIYRLKPEADK